MSINQNYTIFRFASLSTSAILLLWYFLDIDFSQFPSLNFLPNTSENILAFLVVGLLLFFISEVIFEWTKIDKKQLKQDIIQFYITISMAIVTIISIYPKIVSSTFLEATNRYDLITPILFGLILSPVCVLFRDSIEISIVFWKLRKRIYPIHLIMIIVPLLAISLIIYINNYLIQKYELTVYIFRYSIFTLIFTISYYLIIHKAKSLSSNALKKLSILSDSLDRKVEISKFEDLPPKSILNSKRKHRKIINHITRVNKKYFDNIKVRFQILKQLELYVNNGKLYVNEINNDESVILATYIDKKNNAILEKYYIKFEYIKSAIEQINATGIQTKITKNNYNSLLDNIAYAALKLSISNERNCNSSLFIAVQEGNLSQLKLILNDENIDINHQLENGYTALTLAVANGNQEKSKLLLQKAADPNIPNKLSVTPLGFAAFYGNKELCKLLVSFGAQINYQDIDGSSPLMKAAQNGHGDVVKFLL